MKEVHYAAVFEKAPGNYSAYVSGLPWCIAAGDTREEVEQLMREAIGLHLELMRESAEPIPEPAACSEFVTVWM